MSSRKKLSAVAFFVIVATFILANNKLSYEPQLSYTYSCFFVLYMIAGINLVYYERLYPSSKRELIVYLLTLVVTSYFLITNQRESDWYSNPLITDM